MDLVKLDRVLSGKGYAVCCAQRQSKEQRLLHASHPSLEVFHHNVTTVLVLLVYNRFLLYGILLESSICAESFA